MGGALAEDGVEGWIDVSSCGVKPNDNMFVVHAKGDSMMPKIHNGDFMIISNQGQLLRSTMKEIPLIGFTSNCVDEDIRFTYEPNSYCCASLILL